MPKQTLLRGVLVAVLGAALLMPGLAQTPAEANEVGAETFTEGAVRVLIDGIPMEFDPAPYVLPPGRTMVPLRAVFEHLGARVAWDEAARTVTAERGGQTVRLTEGSRTAYINGQAYELDVAPEIRHNRIFIPLRFVAEGLQATVVYDEETREIFVTSQDAPLRSLALTKGMKLNFRLMMVQLVLHHHWEVVVKEAEAFPGPITYRFEGTLAEAALPAQERTLVSLEAGRRFLPTAVAVAGAETETAPWVSAQVYQDLKTVGRAENFVMGGFTVGGQLPGPLTFVEESPLVFSMAGGRVTVNTLQAVTPGGDRFWILDDPANPLVLKFQPVGFPLPSAYGTVGYQIESVEMDVQ